MSPSGIEPETFQLVAPRVLVLLLVVVVVVAVLVVIVVKVKQSMYKPGQTLRIPGS